MQGLNWQIWRGYPWRLSVRWPSSGKPPLSETMCYLKSGRACTAPWLSGQACTFERLVFVSWCRSFFPFQKPFLVLCLLPLVINVFSQQSSSLNTFPNNKVTCSNPAKVCVFSLFPTLVIKGWRMICYVCKYRSEILKKGLINCFSSFKSIWSTKKLTCRLWNLKQRMHSYL